MRKLGLLAVLSVGMLWLSPLCRAEAIDDFTNALCQIKGGCAAGSFSGGKRTKITDEEDEGSDVSPKWGNLSTSLGKKWALLKDAVAREDAKQPSKGQSVSEITDDINEILTKMVENVEFRWTALEKNKSQGMKAVDVMQVQGPLTDETMHTIMFSIENTTYGVVKTMRGLVQFPLRIEELAHLIPLFEYAAKYMMAPEYQERLKKMQILMKCITLKTQEKRSAAKMSGKPVCKDLDCVKLDRCARYIVDTSIYLMRPLVDTFVTGVTIGGRKFEGGILTAMRIVAPEDTIKDIQNAANVLKLIMHLLEQMDKMLAQNITK